MDKTTFVIIGFITIFCLILFFVLTTPSRINQKARKKAGKQGEEIANARLTSILKQDDHLYRNIEVNINGKQTELDNVIVNQNGVFIIEVKNFSGEIFGKEDDLYWMKDKVSEAGNVYEKQIKNPIVQCKREIYLLSQYLRAKNINCWIEGFVYMVNANSPIESQFIYNDIKLIEERIHTPSTKSLNQTKIEYLGVFLGK